MQRLCYFTTLPLHMALISSASRRISLIARPPAAHAFTRVLMAYLTGRNILTALISPIAATRTANRVIRRRASSTTKLHVTAQPHIRPSPIHSLKYRYTLISLARLLMQINFLIAFIILDAGHFRYQQLGLMRDEFSNIYAFHFSSLRLCFAPKGAFFI